MRFLLLTALPITPQSKVSKCVSMSMYRSIAVCEPVRKIVFFNKRTVQIPTTQCPAYVSTSEQKSLRVEAAVYEPVTGTTSFVSRTPCVNMCCEFFTPIKLLPCRPRIWIPRWTESRGWVWTCQRYLFAASNQLLYAAVVSTTKVNSMSP